jgi:hypothetical protein
MKASLKPAIRQELIIVLVNYTALLTATDYSSYQASTPTSQHLLQTAE